ncbi:MAG TPA: Hsp70 family protein, partial [Thermoanaerobaculia bacterium]
LQGEREMARDNRTLGRFHLVGIPTAPRGMPQIEVTFDIDANGIVNVSAKDLGTGKEQKITITATSGLDDNAIEQMVKDAESHAAEDKERRKKVETRNTLDNLVYQSQKTLDENKEKVAPEVQGQVGSALETAKKALEGDDVAAMEKAIEELQQAGHKLAEAMYQQASAGAGAGTAGGPGGAGPGAAGGPSAGAAGGEEEVIDAEYVDVEKGS